MQAGTVINLSRNSAKTRSLAIRKVAKNRDNEK